MHMSFEAKSTLAFARTYASSRDKRLRVCRGKLAATDIAGRRHRRRGGFTRPLILQAFPSCSFPVISKGAKDDGIEMIKTMKSEKDRLEACI